MASQGMEKADADLRPRLESLRAENLFAEPPLSSGPSRTWQELQRHLEWQSKLLESSRHHDRFLIIRPGDRWVACPAVRNSSKRACSFRVDAARLRALEPRALDDVYTGRMPWDSLLLQAQHHASDGVTTMTSRAPPGLGNIVEGLVFGAVLAVASRRVFLVEGWPSAAAAFEAPLTHLLLGSNASRASRAWAVRLAQAQPPQSPRFDTFASHDGSSAVDFICASPLEVQPSAPVWRIYTNENALPLLRTNDHARNSTAFLRADGAAAWPAIVRALLRPRAHVLSAADAFYDAHMRGHVTLGMHFRCAVVDGFCHRSALASAIRCARARLEALQNRTGVRPRLFLAALHGRTRAYLASALSPYASGAALWQSEESEWQDATDEQEQVCGWLRHAPFDGCAITSWSAWEGGCDCGARRLIAVCVSAP